MSKGEGGCTARLLEGGRLVISTQLDPRKVKYPSRCSCAQCLMNSLGWAPSTFVSSRGERAKAKAARPEDFMDEEDLQELRDSRQLVSTVEQSDLSGIFGAQKPSGDDEDVGQE